jgi:hypothetical protein
MAFSSRNEFIEWLQELPLEDLTKLYALTVSVDQDVKNPDEIINNAIADMRINKICDWTAELEEERCNQFSV